MAGIEDVAALANSGDSELEVRARKLFIRVLDEYEKMLDTLPPAGKQKMLLAGLSQIAKMVKDETQDATLVAMRVQLDALAAADRATVVERPIIDGLDALTGLPEDAPPS